MKICDAFDETRGGIAGLERDAHDFAPGGLDCLVLAMGCFIGARGAPSDEDIGPQARKEFAGRWLVELDDVIYGSERGKDFRALGGGRDRPRRSIFSRPLAGASFPARSGPNARVTLDGDDEDVAQSARLFKQANVAGMKQVEAAAYAHQSPAVAFPLAPVENQLALRDNLSQTYVPRPIPSGTAEQLILPRALYAPRRAS